MNLQHTVIQMESGEFVLVHKVLDKLLKLSLEMKDAHGDHLMRELFEAYETGIKEVKVSLESNLIEG